MTRLHLESLERLLGAWGRWLQHRHEPHGTGYPPTSPVHKAMVYGCRIDAAHDNGPEVTVHEQRMLEIHTAVEAMPQPLQMAALLRYAVPGKEKDKPRRGELTAQEYRLHSRDVLLFILGYEAAQRSATNTRAVRVGHGVR